MSKGFIPIRRTLFDHFLFKEKRIFSRFEAWLDLIQLASFKESSDIICGKLVTKDRGEIIASVRYLSTRWGWSIHKVCDYLELLRSQDMVVVDKENGISKITLLNFERHNSLKIFEENEETQKRDSKRDAESVTGTVLPKNKGTPKGTKKGQAGDSGGTNIKKDNNLKKDNYLPTPDFLKRDKEFYESLIPFKDVYPKEMLRAFYNYWSEPNRAKTKMKFEFNKTWDVKRRLSTWENNQGKFDKNQKNEVNNENAAIGRQISEKKDGNYSTLSNNISVYGKVPPQAVELEEVILGAIMLERDAFDNVIEILKPGCFYLEKHQIIFKAMISLQQKNYPIDLLTVVEELKLTGDLDRVGGPVGLTQLQKHVFSSANIETHARIIFEKFLNREMIAITGEIMQLAYEDSTDAFALLDYAEKSLGNIGLNHISGGMIPIEKAMMEAIGKIEEWRHKGESITGISSGFMELDKATRGWQGDLIIIAARPSVGKTAFALNIIKTAASHPMKKVAVGVWSLEMKAVWLALRMLAAESKTILYKLQIGRLSDQEMEDISKTAMNILGRLKIYFEENTNITIESLSRKARRLKKKEGLGLIVIDYLQLMSGQDKKGNREQEIARISRDLKNLAQELDIPIIALSQLSREMGAKNVSWEYGPPLSAIRESGAIEQDADVVLMLWGPSDEEIAKEPSLASKRKVRIAKQRNGVLVTEVLNFRSEIQLFERIEDFMSPGLNFTPVSSLSAKNYYEPENDDMPF